MSAMRTVLAGVTLAKLRSAGAPGADHQQHGAARVRATGDTDRADALVVVGVAGDDEVDAAVPRRTPEVVDSRRCRRARRRS